MQHRSWAGMVGAVLNLGTWDHNAAVWSEMWGRSSNCNSGSYWCYLLSICPMKMISAAISWHILKGYCFTVSYAKPTYRKQYYYWTPNNIKPYFFPTDQLDIIFFFKKSVCFFFPYYFLNKTLFRKVTDGRDTALMIVSSPVHLNANQLQMPGPRGQNWTCQVYRNRKMYRKYMLDVFSFHHSTNVSVHIRGHEILTGFSSPGLLRCFWNVSGICLDGRSEMPPFVLTDNQITGASSTAIEARHQNPLS